MLVTRKIGKLLRGKATPAQLMLACVLGSMLGFMPGFTQAAGAIIALMFLLVILNANLFVAAMSGLLGKLLALLLMPVTFEVGRFLLDGPTSGLFKALINAPVLALFGFEYYVTTGGLAIGLLVGIILGLLVVRALTAFRAQMHKLESGSERFRTFSSTWYAKLFTFLFIGGGHGKLTYEQLMQKKIGNPIRVMGVVAVALATVLLIVLQQFASGPIAAMAIHKGLERANGATVDLEEVDIDLRQGRLVVTKLAMADANDLTTDIFRADRLEADISAADLLRKRIALDQVTFANGSSGEARAIRGRHVGPSPKPVDEDVVAEPGEKSIEEYIRDAQQWKERLAQARQWLERIGGPAEEAAERVEPLRDRLKRQIAEHGYAWTKASHLIDGAPTVMIYALDAEKVRTPYLDGATLDIRGRNISTHPHLASEPVKIVVTSSDDRLGLDLSLDRVVDAAATSTLAFHYHGLPTDAFAQHLAFAGNTPPISGGTIDVSVSGAIDGRGWVDLPMQTTLRGTTVAIGGSSRDVERLDFPLGVRGPIDDPRILFDGSSFADALVKAGAGELAGKLQDKLDDKVGEKLDGLGDRLPGELREGIGNLFPGRGN